MEEKIFCKTHLNEYAENYCEECKLFICPHCALSPKHFSHINKIKTIEEIIKQKIKGINDFKNFSLYKTTELFQFIINYNSFYNPFEYSYIINLINEQFEKYIQKIIELKIQIINLFSQKFDIISNVLKSTKNSVLETQHKLLLNINEKNKDNNNEYLNKINLCLEKIRFNKNNNEIMNFINEYQTLINKCFENEEDLNKKYNFYLAYKYFNDISSNFKDNFFDKLIIPYFNKSMTQLEELIKQLNENEKKDYEKFKLKINELNIDTNILNKKDINKKNNEDNTNKLNIKEEKKENNKISQNKIIDKIKKFEENKLNQKLEKDKIDINKESKKEENINKQIEQNNVIDSKKEEIKKEPKKDNIKNEIKEQKSKEDNDNKKKEKENIIKKLENKINSKQNDKIDNSNIIFQPPKIEGGKMTQEEINNLKGDEEEKFLKKELEEEDKEIGSSLLNSKMIEKTELEIARNIIDELDDRLDIQYYEGIKFSDEDEKVDLNNAYLEDNDNKDENKEIKNKEKNEIKKEENNIKQKEEENKDNNINKENEEKNNLKNNEKDNEKEKEKEKGSIDFNKKKETLNQLFGIKDNNNNQKNDRNENKKENEKKNEKENEKEKGNEIKHIPSFKLDDQWVNIEPEPKIDNKKQDIPKAKTKDKNSRKTMNKNSSNYNNLFGIENKSKQKEVQNLENKKENEEQKDKDIPKEEEEKEIVVEEPKIPAPKNKESIEKLKKLYNIIKEGGKNKEEYNGLFNSLTWEEKNYIEIIGLKSSDSIAFVYNQISDTIENLETKLKFPSHQSYINVHPYVYLSGGKESNKPISLIRRLRKINNKFKIEEIGNLIEARSHHSTIYIKSMDSLIFISGTKTKTCEKFNLSNRKIENFPPVKNSREKCGTCLINKDTLYIFFGFDKSKSKFETSVERIYLNKPKSWEVISIAGDQNLLKRQSMACIPFIPFNIKDKKGVIITGGIGNLRNESDDTIFIDLEKNNVNKFNYLPFGASFTNPNFLPLTLGVETKIVYNITNENKIVSFNLENYTFLGTE